MTADLFVNAELSVIESRLTGKLVLNEFVDETAEIVQLVCRRKMYFVLEDCTELKDWFSPHDLYDAIEVLLLSGVVYKLKVAVILPSPAETIFNIRFWEAVCNYSNIKLAVFENRQNAIDWLGV